MRWSDFTRAQPVRKGWFNANNRLVIRAKLGNEWCKVYEAASKEHACMISKLSKMPEVNGNLPNVLGMIDRWVVASWVSGGTFRRKVGLTEILGIQQRFHSFEAGQKFSKSNIFDYWLDFIRPRFITAARFLGLELTARDKLSAADDYFLQELRCVSHPDLTRGNVVYCKKDCVYKVIDNEFLSYSGCRYMDLLNTLRSLSPGERDKYLKAYFSGNNSLRSFEDNLRVLEFSWICRLVGSYYSSGQFSRANKLYTDYENGRWVLPFSRETLGSLNM